MLRRPVRPAGELIPRREVGLRLNISLFSLDRWRKGSKHRRPCPIAYVGVGTCKRVFFVEDELIAWMKENRADLWKIWLWQQQILAS